MKVKAKSRGLGLLGLAGAVSLLLVLARGSSAGHTQYEEGDYRVDLAKVSDGIQWTVSDSLGTPLGYGVASSVPQAKVDAKRAIEKLEVQ